MNGTERPPKIMKLKVWKFSLLCQLSGGNHSNQYSTVMFFFSLSLSLVLMWRMACRWVEVHWTLRLAQVLVWYFRATSPTVSAVSLSSTALTQTSTFHPKPCPATHPLPATCEYFKDTLCSIRTPVNQQIPKPFCILYCGVVELYLEGSLEAVPENLLITADDRLESTY